MTLLAFTPRTRPVLNDGAELARQLEALRKAAAPAAGLEQRVLAGVMARLETVERPGPRWRIGGWAPVAAAACLLCLLTGGLMVARETAQAGPSQALSGAVLAPQKSDSGFATAAARHEAPGPIATGRRRGRSTRLLNRATDAGPAVAHLPQ